MYELIQIFSASTFKLDTEVYEYNSGYKDCIFSLEITPRPNHSIISWRSVYVRGVIYFIAI